MSVTEHTLTSKYEQEIIFHLNEIKYWEDQAEEAKFELDLALDKVLHHQNQLVALEEPTCA
jgi:hypothetical protein